MRRQIKDYLEDAASAKMAAEELRRENAALRKRWTTCTAVPDERSLMEQTVLQRPEILAPPAMLICCGLRCLPGLTPYILGWMATMRGAALGTLTLMPCAKPSVFVMPAGLRCM